MRTIMAAILGALLAGSVSAAAVNSWDDFVAEKKASVKEKTKGIGDIGNLRDSDCRKFEKIPISLKACQAAYKVIIDRRTAEQSELELMIAAVALDSESRDRLVLGVASTPEYNQFDARTSSMLDEVHNIFSMPKLRR